MWEYRIADSVPKETKYEADSGIRSSGLLIASMAPAHACMFDTDCSPGSRCTKGSGSIYGICMAGTFPGNDNDQRPVRDIFGGSTGNTCSFDVDCGIGHKCVKSGIYGVCVRSQ